MAPTALAPLGVKGVLAAVAATGNPLGRVVLEVVGEEAQIVQLQAVVMVAVVVGRTQHQAQADLLLSISYIKKAIHALRTHTKPYRHTNSACTT